MQAISFAAGVIARFYPTMAKRGVNAYGHSGGWSRTRLVTGSEFAVDALVLDRTRQREVIAGGPVQKYCARALELATRDPVPGMLCKEHFTACADTMP